jgi:hypothetical protein
MDWDPTEQCKSLYRGFTTLTQLPSPPHYIHNKTVDASPHSGPNDIHDFVPEDDVPVIMNTNEPFEEPTPCTSHLAIHTIPGT